MDQSPNWRISVAAVLDLLKEYHSELADTTHMAYALRNTLKEMDPHFEEQFAKNYAAITDELSAANRITQHLLEKIAGQLRDDPNWRD